jgi:hypothetical protein
VISTLFRSVFKHRLISTVVPEFVFERPGPPKARPMIDDPRQIPKNGFFPSN